MLESEQRMDNVTEEDVVWRTYPDCPFIEVNQFGQVRTKDHWVTYKNGRRQLYKGHVLKQYPNSKGYMYVQFGMNGEVVYLSVHRAVATCFIPNPGNLPEVNHIDNDKTNNVASNLEWCTSKYNHDYKTKFGTSPADIQGKPVIAINLETSEVFWFESQHEAARQLGVFNQNLNHVVKGKLNKTGGFWFCYAEENAVRKTRAKFGDEMAEKVEKLINNNSNCHNKF